MSRHLLATRGFVRSEMSVDRRILQIAARQHNLVTRDQLLKIHVSDALIARRIRSGVWYRKHPGVYAVVAAADRRLQDLLAACLAAGRESLVSHLSAATLLELEGVAADATEIVMPHGNLATPQNVVVHRSRDLTRRDRALYKGVPVTTPIRTIIDIAGCVDFLTLETAADDAHRRNLFTYDRIKARADELCGRGRRGSSAIKKLLAERDPDAPIAGSALETRFRRLLAMAGLRLPVSQHEVHDRGAFVARVDFAYPEIAVAFEVDGYRWHTGRKAHDKQRARRRRLTGLGWVVVEFTWTDIRDHPEDVCADVARHLALRMLSA